jgi:Protein of unknown function (DUF2975)
MDTFRPGHAVRLLAAITTWMYYAAVALGLVLALGLTAAEIFAGPDGLRKFILGPAATLRMDDARLTSSWGSDPVTVELKEVRTTLRVPMSVAPAWFRAWSYLGWAMMYAVVLLFLHHLRQVFLAARAGAPFHARNANRLRWLGVLLLAGHLVGQVVGFWQATTLLRTVTSNTGRFDPRFDVDAGTVIAALLLVALAEIFRRGAALEDEQSLVV